MKLSVNMLGMVLAVVVANVAYAFDDDVYGEAGSPEYKEPPAQPEQEVVLPAYPSNDKLIEVSLGIKNNPFALFIDSESLTVGKDPVVWYTAILRSRSGAENVVYEALRCDSRQYRRYAFGADGAFQPVRNSVWKYVRDGRQDTYRTILLDEYFCPAPGQGRAHKIVNKLAGRSPKKNIHVFE